MTNDQVKNVIVIGSGPAGYTAAIYLARAELRPLVFAGEKGGGQLMLTAEVENFPGFETGVMGPDLMTKMRKQAERFGTEIIDKNVSRVDFSKRPFSVWVGDEVYKAKAVVIATGAESRLLGVEGEREFLGKGVSTCAVCDAPFYKDKQQVYVVGGGDAAMEEVLAIAKYAKNVGLIHRRDTLRASKVMVRRVQALKNVQFFWNSEVLKVKGSADLPAPACADRQAGQNSASAILVKNNKTNETKELAMDGLFVAIGHKPVTEIFKDQLDLDEKGYVKTGLIYQVDEKFPGLAKAEPRAGKMQSVRQVRQVHCRQAQDKNLQLWLAGYPTMTSKEGVFAAGDVVDFRYRQAVTAAGFGTMAALDVEKWLNQ